MARKKVLHVSTVPLTPVIDGVRIPAYNSYMALKEVYDVDVLYLLKGEYRLDRIEIGDSYKVTSGVAMRTYQRSRLARIFDEIFKSEPYYGGFMLDLHVCQINNWREYDMIWCATSPAAAFVSSKYGRTLFGEIAAVAGVSDLHSLVVFNQGLYATISVSRAYRWWTQFLGALRGPILYRAELKMLGRFSLVMVQSEKESAWIHRQGDTELTEKIRILPNGVHEPLFALPITRGLPRLVFVGRLDGLYAERLSWFLNKVYARLKLQHPGVELVVVGKFPTEALQQLMTANNVEHIEFVDDLCDVYRDKVALVAPIFKGFGLINKVVEAMAAGCAVVGDRTAFNGIENFVPGEHGMVADDAEGFIRQLSLLLSTPDWQVSVRLSGRQMVHEDFSWRTRYTRIQSEVGKLVSYISSESV